MPDVAGHTSEVSDESARRQESEEVGEDPTDRPESEREASLLADAKDRLADLRAAFDDASENGVDALTLALYFHLDSLDRSRERARAADHAKRGELIGRLGHNLGQLLLPAVGIVLGIALTTSQLVEAPDKSLTLETHVDGRVLYSFLVFVALTVLAVTGVAHWSRRAIDRAKQADWAIEKPSLWRRYRYSARARVTVSQIRTAVMVVVVTSLTATVGDWIPRHEVLAGAVLVAGVALVVSEQRYRANAIKMLRSEIAGKKRTEAFDFNHGVPTIGDVVSLQTFTALLTLRAMEGQSASPTPTPTPPSQASPASPQPGGWWDWLREMPIDRRSPGRRERRPPLST